MNKTEKAKQKKAEQKEKIRQGLTVLQENPPLRILALDDWGELSITRNEFDLLRKEILHCNFTKFETLCDEMIERSCFLLFSLIESGGLCVRKPQNIITKLKIDRDSIILGYLALPTQRQDLEEEEPVFCRQPLHILGRNHLLAFVYFRVKAQNALENDLLLPDLPKNLTEFRQLTSLNWLNDLKVKPNWKAIFQLWLNHKISLFRKKETNADWEDIRKIALWNLFDKEQFPIISAYRQRKFSTAN
jgi:hypothetical protein